MHHTSQLVVLKNHLQSQPFASVSIGSAIKLLRLKSDTIQARRNRCTDEAINHMLTISDIEQCNIILKDIQ